MSGQIENTIHNALLEYVSHRPKQGVIDTCEFSGLAVVYYIAEQEHGIVPGAYLTDISWGHRDNYELIIKIDNIIDFIAGEEHQSKELEELYKIFADELQEAGY